MILDFETRQMLREKVSEARRARAIRTDRLERRRPGGHHKNGSWITKTARRWQIRNFTIDDLEVICNECGKRTLRQGGQGQRHLEPCSQYDDDRAAYLKRSRR